MSFIRINRSHRLLRSVDAFSQARLATLAVKLTFALLLAALLYSATIGTAAADVNAPRVLQSLASIRSAAEEYVRTSAAAGTPSDTLVATATELDSRLQLAQCSKPLTAFTLNAAPITARTTVGVRCESASAGAEWTVYVPVIIESEIDVLVVRNSMPRDAHLASGDLSTERRRVPGIGTEYMKDPAQLRDQHLKRSIPAGTALMADMFMRDLVVKRGQHVMLVFDAGGLAVQAPGLALADGGTADRIRVQNQTSLKIVEGVIESGNLVRVGL